MDQRRGHRALRALLHHRHIIRHALHDLGDAGTALPLHYDTEILMGKLQYLLNMGDHPHRIHILRLGIVLFQILLCYQKNALVLFHRLVQCSDGFQPPHIKVHHRLRKADHPPQHQ